MTVKSLGYGSPSVAVTWDTLPGKPTAFAPAAHTHAWSDITGKPATFIPAPHTHLWADITDKPFTYQPSAHTHSISDVTGLQAALDSKVAPTWATLAGKPSTFPPSAHTHFWADITDRPSIPTLSTITPLAPAATGVIGTSTMAAKADHQHPLQGGTLTFLGNVSVAETTLLSLSLGMKRMTLTLAGVAAGDKLTFFPNGIPTTGCEAVNVYATAANTISVAYFVPALGLGATYSIPIAVYRLT